jgi:hypothetical protein
MLRALTPEQLARAEERLLHPAPGSRIEVAGRHGVDLTLLVEELRLTPAERARKLEMASEAWGSFAVSRAGAADAIPKSGSGVV